MAEQGEKTQRQRLLELLSSNCWDFEELRELEELSVQALEEDLRHIARSLRRGHRRLRVEPARCTACGFVFPERERRRYHPPGRCPRCRSERIRGPWLEIR